MLGGITDIIIGTRDREPWFGLLRDALGYDLVAEGTDTGPFGEGRRASVLSAGVETGRIRLIETLGAPDPVRPAVRDLGLFDLDIYVRDLDAAYQRLTALGHQFRVKPEPWTIEKPPITLKEGLILAPDGVNLMLVESANPRGIAAWAADPERPYSEVTSSVAIVRDIDASLHFWRDGLGMQVPLDFTIAHPALEDLLELEPGASFRMIVASQAGLTARIELIAFPASDSPGTDRSGDQRPGALGIIGWGFRVNDLDGALAAIQAAGGLLIDPPAPVDDPVHGRGRAATARTPDGSLIEIWAADSPNG